jgi:hypothetical protein
LEEHGDAEQEAAGDSSPADEPVTQAAGEPPLAATPPPPATSPPTGEPPLPDYKGAPLDPDRGPGLGCFWFQVILLVALLVLTPVSVWLSAPSWVSAALLIIVLVLLFFVGQTMIFLLRLVAADRRTRRRPLAPTARQTVGQIEDAQTSSQSQPTSGQDDAAPDEPLT